MVFRLGAELPAVSRPGTRQSASARGSAPPGTGAGAGARSGLAEKLYGSAFAVDCDGGYDALFGLVLLVLAGHTPQMVTTVHGMGESVSSAVTIKRLLATMLCPHVPVVPSVDVADARGQGGQLCMSRPGTSLVRLDGSTRRVPSRFGPDYRRHLAMLADHLFLAPLGVSHGPLLAAPGLTLRIASLEHDLRLLSTVAGADVAELEGELASVARAVQALSERGKAYYSELGMGLVRDQSRRPSPYFTLPEESWAAVAAAEWGRLSTVKSGGAQLSLATDSARGPMRVPRDTLREQSRAGGILRPYSREAGGAGGRRRVERVDLRTPDEAAGRRASFAPLLPAAKEHGGAGNGDAGGGDGSGSGDEAAAGLERGEGPLERGEGGRSAGEVDGDDGGRGRQEDEGDNWEAAGREREAGRLGRGGVVDGAGEMRDACDLTTDACIECATRATSRLMHASNARRVRPHD